MKKKCFKIVLDCQDNDDVDIRCGGPDCLGYDFFVPVDIVDEITAYILETCRELGTPVLAIYYDADEIYDKEVKDIWTKERIYNCIKNNEAGLDLNTTNTI